MKTFIEILKDIVVKLGGTVKNNSSEFGIIKAINEAVGAFATNTQNSINSLVEDVTDVEERVTALEEGGGEIPVATESVLGGIKSTPRAGLTVKSDGTINSDTRDVTLVYNGFNDVLINYTHNINNATAISWKRSNKINVSSIKGPFIIDCTFFPETNGVNGIHFNPIVKTYTSNRNTYYVSGTTVAMSENKDYLFVGSIDGESSYQDYTNKAVNLIYTVTGILYKIGDNS